jgi:hypothetical protein
MFREASFLIDKMLSLRIVFSWSTGIKIALPAEIETVSPHVIWRFNVPNNSKMWEKKKAKGKGLKRRKYVPVMGCETPPPPLAVGQKGRPETF